MKFCFPKDRDRMIEKSKSDYSAVRSAKRIRFHRIKKRDYATSI